MHALSLETALKRYAKPLFKPPMRIFRDEQILRPGDDLPQTIRESLEASEWLLLLAEKGAADSPWVVDELRIWCRDLGRVDRLVIIHIADEISVDATAQRIEWAETNALPRALEAHLPSLPIYADFTWAVRDEERDLGNSRYKSLINGLVARFRGVTPESMMGTEVLTHRRNVRVRNLGITAVVMSAIVAVLLGLVAVQRQWEAEDRTAFSHSQRLAAQSTVELQAGRLDLALLLGVEAFRPLERMRKRRRTDAFDATSALFRATYATPRLQTYLFRAGGLERARFSDDGRLLTLVARDGIHWWDAASLERLPTLLDHVEEGDRPITQRQGLLALRAWGRVVVVDEQTREVLKAFRTGQGGASYGPALSPSSATIAVGAGDGSVFLWDMAEPRSRARILRGHTSNVVSLAFSPDGMTLATGSWDRTIRLWDATSGRPHGGPLEHPGQVEDLAYSPDGETLAVAAGGSVTLWNARTRTRIGRPLPHEGKVSSLAIHPAGTWLAAAGPDSNRVLLWRLPPDGGDPAYLEGHASGLKQVAFNPGDGALVSVSHTGTAILWRDVDQELPGETLVARLDEPRTLAVGRNGEIAVGDCGERPERRPCSGGRVSRLRYAGTASSRSPRPGPMDDPLRGHPGAVEALAFAGEGDELVSASCASVSGSACTGALVHRWGRDRAAPLGERPLAPDREIRRMALDARGEILVGILPDRRQPAWSGPPKGYDVWLWDVRTGELLAEPWAGGDRLFTHLVFSTFEPRLLAASGADTRIWRLDTGEQLFEVEGGKLAFDAIGRTMVTISKGVFEQTRLRIWDVATGIERQEIVTPTTDVIVSSALSPDGELLALGDTEGRITLWHLGVNQMMGLPLRVHAESVSRLAFGDDGRVLYSTGRDGRVVALELDAARWTTRACRRGQRNLTYPEWVQFFGDEAYRLTCADLPVHPSLLESGRRLAEAGDWEGGSALMARAAELGDPRVADATAEARSLATQGFLDRAEQVARVGQVRLATQHFQQALALDPGLNVDPAARAAAIAAPGFAERADRLARLHRTDQALAAIDRALALDPDVSVSAETWHRLCRSGIVSGEAERVAEACARAVELSEGRRNYFAALGVAQAMIGDVDAAIASLEAYLAYEAQPMRFRGDTRDPPEAVERVERWLDALRAGEPPLSEPDIEGFASETR